MSTHADAALVENVKRDPDVPRDVAPIERELRNLDDALDEAAAAVEWLLSRIERIENRIAPVLGPHRSSADVTGVADAPRGERDQSVLASEIEERVSRLRRISGGVRDIGHRADEITLRVEL